MIDAVLTPGDVLYLPRGFLHSATALGEISAHLTVGIHPVTRWRRGVGARPGAHPRRRGPSPARFVPRARPHRPRHDPGRRDRGARRPARVAGSRRPDDVSERLRARIWAQVRPEPVAPLASSAAATALTVDSVVRLRRRLRCVLRDGEDGRVTLLCGPADALVPGEVREALAGLLAAGELKVGDLPGLDDADRLVLARRLVTDAIATVASRRPRGSTGRHSADVHDRRRGDDRRAGR